MSGEGASGNGYTAAGAGRVYRYRWAIFAVLVAAYFFVYFHRVSLGVLGSDIIAAVGGSLGILSSLYFYTYLLMQVPSGIMSDRLGPRTAASAFLVLAAAGSFLTCVSTDFVGVAAGKVMIAAGMAVVYVPLMKIVAVWFKWRDFSAMNGIVIAVGNVGAIAAAAPLAMLNEAIGWREVFAILGAVTLLLSLLCILVVRNHPRDMGLPAMEDIEEAEDGRRADDDTGAKMPVMAGLREVVRGGRKFWTLALAYMLVYGTIMAYQGTWANAYFKDVYSFGIQAAWFLTMIGIGKIVSTVAVGVLTSRAGFSRKRVLMFGSFCFAAVWAAIWLLAGQVQDYWFWFAVNTMFGFFGGFMTLSFTQVKEWYPVAISGTVVSAMNMFLFLGAALATTVGAFVVADGGLEAYTGMWGLLFACSAAAFILVCLSKEKERNARARPSRVQSF